MIPLAKSSASPRETRVFSSATPRTRLVSLIDIEVVQEIRRGAHGKTPPPEAQPTESLFAENHEPFFNAIDPERTCGGCEEAFRPSAAA